MRRVVISEFLAGQKCDETMSQVLNTSRSLIETIKVVNGRNEISKIYHPIKIKYPNHNHRRF